MSGLSANVASCGGEGDRGGLWGDSGGNDCVDFFCTAAAFLRALRNIGAILIRSSSEPGADDKDEESPSDMAADRYPTAIQLIQTRASRFVNLKVREQEVCRWHI